MDGKNRKDIQIGQNVEIVQKNDQRTGNLTEGSVKRILTKSANHPHGIKVQLETGEVGRVKNICNYSGTNLEISLSVLKILTLFLMVVSITERMIAKSIALS